MQQPRQQKIDFSPKYLVLLLAALFANNAFAETATQVGTVVVEGQSEQGTGLIVQEESAKARSSVGKSYLENQSSSNSPYQNMALLPGVNAFSTDATGLFGGTMTMRGFNSDQLGVTIDGAPVNDSGNFAVYPQEYVDSENLQELFVTQGSTDTEAPHVGASGGNVGIVSMNPRDRFDVKLAQTFGSNNLRRTFVRLDSGKLNSGATTAFVSYSKSQADKWRGLGNADRDHVDVKLTHEVNPDVHLSGGLVFNTAVNNFFKNVSLVQYNTFGRNYDYATTFGLAPVRAGVAQNAALAVGGALPADYYGLAVNPFENYIATFKANIQINSSMRLDIEPYFWHGFGGGGFGTTLVEPTAATALVAANATTINATSALKTLNGGALIDANGNGVFGDTGLFFRSSVTKTSRPGLTTKLNWNVGSHKLMLGLWFERAEHLQTQPYVRTAGGMATDVWAQSNLVTLANGTVLQGRDWKTISTSSQLFVQDNIGLMNDKLNLVLGVRAPQIRRDGSNYLSLTNPLGVKMVSATYNSVLPTAGFKYQLSDADHMFANIAKNSRAPSNFVLYDLIRTQNAVAETSTNFDLGYRHQTENTTFSGSLFLIDFKDRFALVRDPDGTTRTYNAGNVKAQGFELEMGNNLGGGFSSYTSLSYLDSKLQTNFATRNAANALITLPTAGKTFVDAPKIMAGIGIQYRSGGWALGGQAKYTSKRYSTLMNDESIPAFTLVDLNASYRFPTDGVLKNSVLKFNISNLFDKNALGMINSTQTNARAYTAGGVTMAAATPLYTQLAPRAFSVQLSAEF